MLKMAVYQQYFLFKVPIRGVDKAEVSGTTISNMGKCSVINLPKPPIFDLLR